MAHFKTPPHLEHGHQLVHAAAKVGGGRVGHLVHVGEGVSALRPHDL